MPCVYTAQPLTDLNIKQEFYLFLSLSSLAVSFSTFINRSHKYSGYVIFFFFFIMLKPSLNFIQSSLQRLSRNRLIFFPYHLKIQQSILSESVTRTLHVSLAIKQMCQKSVPVSLWSTWWNFNPVHVFVIRLPTPPLCYFRIPHIHLPTSCCFWLLLRLLLSWSCSLRHEENISVIQSSSWWRWCRNTSLETQCLLHLDTQSVSAICMMCMLAGCVCCDCVDLTSSVFSFFYSSVTTGCHTPYRSVCYLLCLPSLFDLANSIILPFIFLINFLN